MVVLYQYKLLLILLGQFLDMATKTIEWNSGSGYITLTYTGTGNAPISVSSDANDLFEDRQQIVQIATTKGSPQKSVSLLVKQKGKTYPVGTVFNYDYTGSVQQITLPKGKYKLQCWGAQGGDFTGSFNAAGSNGGYSEGILTLSKTTTIYIFVGGKGISSSSSNTSGTANGGWNGGGSSIRYSSYNNDNIKGWSHPRPGGGATDMCLVTSTMNYSSGRTNRSSASLLSRFIVAGGGAGASTRYTKETVTVTTTEDVLINKYRVSDYITTKNIDSGSYYTHLMADFLSIPVAGRKYKVSGSAANWTGNNITLYKDSFTAGNVIYIRSTSYTTMPNFTSIVRCEVRTSIEITDASHFDNLYIEEYEEQTKEEEQVNTSYGASNLSQQGGGVSGRGQYPGTQNSAGSGGDFGLGANQTTSNYRYVSGAGGGGWYGGGKGQSDTGTNYVNYSGGGSGFVNTAANAGYRPSGYTGLELDSGSTKDGSTSFESTSGGTETGHSGNGYARITVLE